MLLVFNNYIFVEFGGLFTKDLEIMLIFVVTHSLNNYFENQGVVR